MSRRRAGGRGAVTGLAIAAAGVIYTRLGGRRALEPAAPEPGAAHGAADAEVRRARAELADELARRAERSDR